jgi:hypothetical protein
MKTSINQLREELKALATAHGQINSFHWGDLLEAISVTPVQYPLMACYYSGATVTDNTTPLSLVIVIADKTGKGQREDNLNDTESDTAQVCRDLFNVLNKSRRWQAIGRVESASAEKFMEGTADEIAGHVLTIQFTLFDTNSVCDLPIFDYDFNMPIPAMVCETYVTKINNLPTATKDCVLNTVCSFEYVDLFYSDGVTLVDTLGSGAEYTIIKHTVQNSDSSYLVEGEFNENTTLPNEDINVYVNGVLNQTATYIPLSNQTINITA